VKKGGFSALIIAAKNADQKDMAVLNEIA